MAVINANPTLLVSGVASYKWETLTEADTAAAITPSGLETLAGSVQVIGTFGGATVVMQGSNDGINWINLLDTTGSEISLSASGAADFSTAMAYLRPSASGGTSQDIDVILVTRGA